jgi:hypothetical protein
MMDGENFSAESSVSKAFITDDPGGESLPLHEPVDVSSDPFRGDTPRLCQNSPARPARPWLGGAYAPRRWDQPGQASLSVPKAFTAWMMGVNARLLPRDVRDRARVFQGGHDAR